MANSNRDYKPYTETELREWEAEIAVVGPNENDFAGSRQIGRFLSTIRRLQRGKVVVFFDSERHIADMYLTGLTNDEVNRVVDAAAETADANDFDGTLKRLLKDAGAVPGYEYGIGPTEVRDG